MYIFRYSRLLVEHQLHGAQEPDHLSLLMISCVIVTV